METYFHLDLKGAPPKPAYLKSLWPILKKWKVSGVILEWEDCFPYTGDIAFLHNGIYSVDEAQEIVYDIREANLEIIPLVQTFGHLEFVLKHPSLIAYREVPIYPSSLCPSYIMSRSLISMIVEQVVEFHQGVKRLHIGADEVWHMGLCEPCKARLSEGELKEDLFLKHVKTVLEDIKNKWPALQLIMWDDMLRSMDETLISSYNLKELVELMVWHYNSAESFSLPPDIWRKYSDFAGIWAAGAFKGASGGSQLVAPTSLHASNILEWMKTITLIPTRIKGFVLTGWSRYDHFAALCETLPCGLPSLGICLRVIADGTFGPETTAMVEFDLKMHKLHTLKKSANANDKMLHSSLQILVQASKLINLRQRASSLMDCEPLQTWMNDWQVSNHRVNPMQIMPIIPPFQNLVDNFNAVELAITPHMEVIFYEGTVKEWMATYLAAPLNRAKNILILAERIITEETQFVEEMNKCFVMDI